MSENRLFCDVCIGKKYVIGMGTIHQECPKCKGLGYVENSNNNSAEIEVIANDITKTYDKINVETDQSENEIIPEIGKWYKNKAGSIDICRENTSASCKLGFPFLIYGQPYNEFGKMIISGQKPEYSLIEEVAVPTKKKGRPKKNG